MMSWILAREEFAYFIYDQDVRPIGYFAPDYATSAGGQDYRYDIGLALGHVSYSVRRD